MSRKKQSSVPDEIQEMVKDAKIVREKEAKNSPQRRKYIQPFLKRSSK